MSNNENKRKCFILGFIGRQIYNFFVKNKLFHTFVTAIWLPFEKSKEMKKTIAMMILPLVALLFAAPAKAQNAQESERVADSLYRSYNFAEARSIYERLAAKAEPAQKRTLDMKIICCQNGEEMLRFVSEPNVVTRKTMDKRDFFLYYPNINIAGGFIHSPEGLNTTSDTLYLANNTNTLYYSAKEVNGSWNIYRTVKGADGVWSIPQKLSGNISTAGNELFPFVSPDGKKFYFSSNGHSGAGGYDLYVCSWDEEKKDWGPAQNMGFPYSSPGDDFFFYVTPDSRYAAFSSTRLLDNPNSPLYSTTMIVTYVVDYQPDPITKALSAKEAANIARLRGAVRTTTDKERDSITNAEINKALKEVDQTKVNSPMDSATVVKTQNYTRESVRCRNLKKREKQMVARQQSTRDLYTEVEERLRATEDSVMVQIRKDSIAKITKIITDDENALLALRQQIRESETALRKMEEEFFNSGVVVPSSRDIELGEEFNVQEDDDEDEDFNPSNMLNDRAKVTDIESFNLQRPKKDLTFKILKKGWLAEWEDLPDGILYQIRFMSSVKPANVASFKGLSPVFEKEQNGRYVYSAGAFTKYSEAQKQLSKVKKLFSTAQITALKEGKAYPLATARKEEAQAAKKSKAEPAGAYNVVISGLERLPEALLHTIKSATGKDMAKVTSAEGTKYIVGPFSSKEEADGVAKKLEETKSGKISVEQVL